MPRFIQQLYWWMTILLVLKVVGILLSSSSLTSIKMNIFLLFYPLPFRMEPFPAVWNNSFLVVADMSACMVGNTPFIFTTRLSKQNPMGMYRHFYSFNWSVIWLSFYLCSRGTLTLTLKLKLENYGENHRSIELWSYGYSLKIRA